MKKKNFIRITQPTLEPFFAYAPLFKESIESGMLTSGSHVRALEERTAKYLGVKHCVAVSSCTSGLMLVFKGLGLSGEIIMPSYTFGGSALPAVWNNLKIVFAEVDPETWNLDPRSVEKLITPRTSAIYATHVFGVMCDVKALEALAKKHKLKLIFDAAHAFGSSAQGVRAGNFGNAEVFSCSPIKLMTTAEGGIVATNDDALAKFVRLGRNYGDDGTNRLLFAGLSARMSEFHAAIGLRSLAKLPVNLKKRSACAKYLISHLSAIAPDIRFQVVPAGMQTTYYLLSAYLDPKKMGFAREELYDFFLQHNIGARKCYPPIHEQLAFKQFAPKKKNSLSLTEEIGERVLSVPLYSHITKKEMDRVISVFQEFITSRKKRARAKR